MKTFLIRIAAAAFLLFFLPFSIRAEVNTVSLTWDQVVASARKTNPDLAASYQFREAARMNVRASYSGFLPSLTLSGGKTFTDTNTGGTWDAQGRAAMDLLNLKNNGALKSNAALLSEAEASYRVQSADVRLQLRQAYADLLFAQKQVDVSQKIKDFRKKNSEMITLKYESGSESKGNMLRARAELVEAQANLNDANRALLVAQKALGRLMGKDDSDVLVASDTFVVPALPSSPDVASLSENHPQVELKQAAKLFSEATLLTAQSSLWPVLTASYARVRTGARFFPDTEHWTAAGVLTYPLFSAGPTSTLYQVKSARRNIDRAEQDLRAARNSVRNNLESTWASLATKIDFVDVQHQYLLAARQRNDEASIRYSSGLMTFENWEIIATDYVNFARSALRAEHDAAVAEAQWQQAMGKGLEE